MFYDGIRLVLEQMTDSNRWFIYMIRCNDGSLYTGSTNHIIRRWHQHRVGNGAKYLRSHKPVELVHVESFKDQSSACKREYAIKQLTKSEKESLISDEWKFHRLIVTHPNVKKRVTKQCLKRVMRSAAAQIFPLAVLNKICLIQGMPPSWQAETGGEQSF